MFDPKARKSIETLTVTSPDFGSDSKIIIRLLNTDETLESLFFQPKKHTIILNHTALPHSPKKKSLKTSEYLTYIKTMPGFVGKKNGKISLMKKEYFNCKFNN